MNSFALWFVSSEKDAKGLCADVHFNLWNMHYRRALPPCLDVGIKLFNVRQCEGFHFYVPFEINGSDITDLGKTLGSSEILCTIFNEDLKLTRQGNEKVLYVADNDANYTMSIYCLDTQNDITIGRKYKGTLITIELPSAVKEAGTTVYFRFRIRSEHFKNIIKTYRPPNVFLQSAISITEAIDFRFNDYRSLNPSLLERMREGIRYNIEKVHFLLITEADVEIQFSSVPAMARELETDVWKGYFDAVEGKHIVAYHWKFKKSDSGKLIENCIMFVKTKVHKCNWFTITVYIIFLSIITLLLNLLTKILFGA